MKVLFLDVDGVLNSATWLLRVREEPDYNGWVVNPYAVGLVAGLMDGTGAKVVISSGWRDFPEHLTKLTDLGIVIHDMLPARGGSRRHARPPRGQEIRDWLAAHPEVEQFAIVDDDDDAGELHPDRFVKTDWNYGLTLRDVEALAELLR